MTIARVLQGALRQPVPARALALEQVFHGITGPLRIPLYRLFAGHDTWPTLEPALADTELHAACRFLSPAVASRLIAASCRDGHHDVAHPHVLRWRRHWDAGCAARQQVEPTVAAFNALPLSRRQAILAMWEQRGTRRMGADELVRASEEQFRPLQALLLALAHDDTDPRPPIHEQIMRLRKYGLPLSDALASRLLEGVSRLDREVAGQPRRITVRTSPAQFRFLEDNGLGDLVLHCHRYREESPDDLRFVLGAARLLQGIRWPEAAEFGWTPDFLRRAEVTGINWLATLRAAAVLYDVPYRVVAQCYLHTIHGRNLKAIRELPFFAPAYLGQVGKDFRYVEAYLAHPGTLGEKLFFAMGQWGLTVEEVAGGAGVHVDVLSKILGNRKQGAPATLEGIATLLGIPFEDICRLALQTYYPRLWDGDQNVPQLARFDSEPVLLNPDSDDYPKLLAYTNSPGTFGEWLFFFRKRGRMTAEALCGLLGHGMPNMIHDLEWNLRRPTAAILEQLARVSGTPLEVLRAMRRDMDVARHHVTQVAVRPRKPRRWQPQGVEPLHMSRVEKRPSRDALLELVERGALPPQRLIRALNAKFDPDIDWHALPSFRDGPFADQQTYIEPMTREWERLRYYQGIGWVTLGEIMWRARKDERRLWLVGEATAHLGLRGRGAGRSYRITEIETNTRPPTDQELQTLFEGYQMHEYGYTLDDLRALRDRGEHRQSLADQA